VTDETERLSVPVDAPELDAVSACFDAAAGPPRPWSVLLAHGAGAGMESAFLRKLARALAERGLGVLRFHYPYAERSARDGRRRPPDRTPVLEAAHARALRVLVERTPGTRTVLAGKSMGGRIASHLAAKDAPCRALVFYGYPLHPPKSPARLRDEHFPAVVQPSLFLQGTRDALCDLELLRSSLRKYGGPATLQVIDGADHGFALPRATGRRPADVILELADRTVAWLESVDPP